MALRRVLVTGGCGYIGSVVCAHLSRRAFNVVALDNFSGCSVAAIHRLRAAAPNVDIIRGDVRDALMMNDVLSSSEYFAVVHLAAVKSMDSQGALGETVSANVDAPRILFDLALAHGIERFIFSSSAAVYGLAQDGPLVETAECLPCSEYGRQKLAAEMHLSRASFSQTVKPTILRLFNVVGADTRGMLGDESNSSVFCRILRARFGEAAFVVLGTQFPNRDGTAIRDYVHVIDVAWAMERAILASGRATKLQCMNIASGRGTSVAELIYTFDKRFATPLPITSGDARSYDVGWSIGNTASAEESLNWRSTKNLDESVDDAIEFHKYCTESGTGLET